MKVLVSVASKHGATEEIGDRIAERLCLALIDVHVVAPNDRLRPDGYDACVIGSAVYMGRWMSEARRFVEANAEKLSERPVWLFSSGPVTPVMDERDEADARRFAEQIRARGHQLFAGRLQQDNLNFGERAVVRMIHSPWGDYRPWHEIDAWADSIARDLRGVAV
ncbi:MAG TPA: flavodoxin domain-containing protein [Candidatus Limnocylindrales bacterium]